MKKILLTLAALTICAAAHARIPNLSVEQFFTDEYRDMPNVEMTRISTDDTWYRRIQVENNNALAKKIQQAIDRDRAHATSVTERYNTDETRVILVIKSNHGDVTVGYTLDKEDNDVSLFISGKPAAFK